MPNYLNNLFLLICDAFKKITLGPTKKIRAGLDTTGEISSIIRGGNEDKTLSPIKRKGLLCFVNVDDQG